MSNTDRVIEELAKTIDQSRGHQRLWVADEQELPDTLLKLLADGNLYLISNRRDQITRARQAGVRAAFSDFDLTHPDNAPWDSIFFRVAKEKAVVHHLLNSATQVLRDEGTLWLAGHKNEGTKTYLAKAEDLFGSKAMVKRGKDQLFVGHLNLYKAGEPLPDDNYQQLRQIEMKAGESYWSKPGLFGWQRVDKGSEFLVERLSAEQADLSGLRVLDLGCGFGYLSCKAAELGASEIVATDNCAAAIQACRKNLLSYGSDQYLCTPSDCADEVKGKFDLILCNPPFHSGFSTTSELHNRFFKAINHKLKSDGEALVVVNQFLRISNLCEANDLCILDRQRDMQRHFDLYRLRLKD